MFIHIFFLFMRYSLLFRYAKPFIQYKSNSFCYICQEKRPVENQPISMNPHFYFQYFPAKFYLFLKRYRLQKLLCP